MICKLPWDMANDEVFFFNSWMTLKTLCKERMIAALFYPVVTYLPRVTHVEKGCTQYSAKWNNCYGR